MDVNKRTLLTRPLGDDDDDERQSGMSKLWPQQLQIRSPAISRACLLAPLFPEHSPHRRMLHFQNFIYGYVLWRSSTDLRPKRCRVIWMSFYYYTRADANLLGPNIHNVQFGSATLCLSESIGVCPDALHSIRFNSVVRRTTWLSRGLLEFLTYIQRTYFLWPYLHLVFANIPFLFGKLIDSLVILLIINDPRVMQRVLITTTQLALISHVYQNLLQTSAARTDGVVQSSSTELYLVLLYSSIHLVSTSPLGITTKDKQLSLSSSPSLGCPPFSLDASKISRNVFFFPTFSNRFRCVAAYTTRLLVMYSPFSSHSGGGAWAGNIVFRWATKVVSSWNSEMMSEVAYWGYKKKTGKTSVFPVGSSKSKCGNTGLEEPPGLLRMTTFLSCQLSVNSLTLGEKETYSIGHLQS